MNPEVPLQPLTPTEELAKIDPALAAKIAAMRDNATQQAKIAGKELFPDTTRQDSPVPVPKQWKKAQHEAKASGDLSTLMRTGPNNQLPPRDRE